jgi:hypothetical protein
MTTTRDNQIEARYLAGESLASIAADLSLTRERVRQIVRTRGLESSRERSARRARAAAEEVKGSKGKVGVTQAAQAFGVAPAKVRAALAEMGFDPVAQRQAQIEQQRLERVEGKGTTICNKCGRERTWAQMALTRGRGKPRRKRVCRDCVAEYSRTYYAGRKGDARP